ncbi:XRE family transcriptional regulator [Arthrobacter sp. lap29]|uniref:helix-turn-helix domain-containing protein n=1 Tax=Arthrobacter sp. lap29 TaxID=3056122 RepID=UPI0028F6EBCA|nr:XRE family transcriptional regulator [Arthrobacter sp. lap29]
MEVDVAEDVERIMTGIAPTLRDLRTKRRISLTEVAGHLNVSVSTMSRLESGERAPTLDLLIPLARLYGVALDDIVKAPPTGDPRIRPHPVKRHGMIYIPLTKSGGPMQAFKMILPGGKHPAATAQTHDGYEWLYVLSGTLDLQLGNTHTAIDVGEAAEFDTRTPHLISSANEQPVELLGLFSPQGERIHITGP